MSQNVATKTIKVNFRWNVEQTDDKAVIVHIPIGPGAPLINPEAVKQLRLNDGEVERAEHAALRQIVVCD